MGDGGGGGWGGGRAAGGAVGVGGGGGQLADLAAPLRLSRSGKGEQLVENREDETETICSEDRGPKTAASLNYPSGKRGLASSPDVLSDVCGPRPSVFFGEYDFM